MITKTLSAQEVREILKISRRTQYAWLRTGRLKGSKVGRKWLFLEEDIEAMLHPTGNTQKQEDMSISDGKGTPAAILKSFGAWARYTSPEEIAKIEHTIVCTRDSRRTEV